MLHFKKLPYIDGHLLNKQWSIRNLDNSEVTSGYKTKTDGTAKVIILYEKYFVLDFNS